MHDWRIVDDPLEGTEVLEQLAECGLLEEFAEAVDSDDAAAAAALMREAGIDTATIAQVLHGMREGGP